MGVMMGWVREHWRGIFSAVALGLLFVVFSPGLRAAAERNVFALQAKPFIITANWSDETRVCEPLAPLPALSVRQCSDSQTCYISDLLALRRGEWDIIQTSGPSDPDPLDVFLRGWSRYCVRSQSHAVAAWQAASGPIGFKFLAEAKVSLAGGEPEIALRQSEIAHALRPTAESFLVMAGAQVALGDTGSALETYYRALEEGMTTAQTFGQVGELEWKLNINNAARAHLAEAVRLDPQAWHYWQVYGALLYRLQDWEQSEVAFSHAAELNPKSGAAHGGVALAQLRLGKLESARRAVEATMTNIKDARGQAGYLAGFAQLAAEAGDLEWSAALYARALERTPNDDGMWNALMATYVRLGDCAKVRSVYRAYTEQMRSPQFEPAPQPACPE